MPLELCINCRRMHYLTDKCPADLRKQANEWFERGDYKTASAYAVEAVDAEVALILADERPLTQDEKALVKEFNAAISKAKKRSGNRHRPGYFTEYMREYRKRPKPSIQTTTEERNEG
jgi:hypothetical protein